MLLCAELAGVDTGVNTKALEYRDNKSDTGTRAHASMHGHARARRRAASQKESSALVAREHMSLQPTWDSEQRKETATPVTAHAWGQTHTDHCICLCVSDREAAKGLSLFFFSFSSKSFNCELARPSLQKEKRGPTPEWRISL